MINLPIALAIAAVLAVVFISLTLSGELARSLGSFLVWAACMYVVSVALLAYNPVQRAIFGKPDYPEAHASIGSISMTIGAAIAIAVTAAVVVNVLLALVDRRSRRARV